MPLRTGQLTPSDIRANIIPAADLDLQGDTGQPLALGSDVQTRLALIGLVGPTGPRLAKCGLNAGMLVSEQPDASGVIGTFGNIWNNVATGASVLGGIVDTLNAPFTVVFITVSAATNITIMLSPDGVNFFQVGVINFGAAGSTAQANTFGARFISLISSVNVTATATLQAKAA